ncbi:M23 family metallopeptidase [Desulfococcus sp.]|uniref:M23 family metallopeptidase n=1 Tax=Desulfococcus sp. TaxID=2025834 RepID=UPI0035942B6E
MSSAFNRSMRRGFHLILPLFTCAWILCLLTLTPSPAWPLTLELPAAAYQGDMIVGRVRPEAPVFVGEQRQAVGRDGVFVIGIERMQPADITVSARDGKTESRKIVRILARQWDIQRIDGLARRYVHPDPEQVKRIEADNRRIEAVRTKPPSPDPWFLDRGFILPVRGRVSSVYGSQRILNGEPKSPHRGIDIAAPEGTPVKSPAAGVARLVAPGLFLMGNALIIDHGLGVQSTFIHLQRILVKEGDRVVQGQTVARVGKTGRASGPHLHWGVSAGTVLVDPQRVVGRRFGE